MTDRHAAYIVTLAEDIREDDAEATLNALRMVRGVADVQPVIADVGSALTANVRLKSELSDSLRSWMQENLR
jgi:hypothetical protein